MLHSPELDHIPGYGATQGCGYLYPGLSGKVPRINFH